MKKIFLPLLALVGMVSCFTLSSCGGGGGGDEGVHNFSNKSIRYYGDSMSGSMLVEISDKRDSTSYNAMVSFGENGTRYAGYFRVLRNDDVPVVKVQLDGEEEFSVDENVRQYYASFLPGEFETNSALYGFPTPTFTMTFNADGKGGTCTAFYSILVGDDPSTENIVEKDYRLEITMENATFFYE